MNTHSSQLSPSLTYHSNRFYEDQALSRQDEVFTEVYTAVNDVQQDSNNDSQQCTSRPDNVCSKIIVLDSTEQHNICTNKQELKNQDGDTCFKTIDSYQLYSCNVSSQYTRQKENLNKNENDEELYTELIDEYSNHIAAAERVEAKQNVQKNKETTPLDSKNEVGGDISDSYSVIFFISTRYK